MSVVEALLALTLRLVAIIELLPADGAVWSDGGRRHFRLVE